jgi:hypothetical protein
MNSNLTNRGVYVVCVAVKSRSVFPELERFEEVILKSSRKNGQLLWSKMSEIGRDFLSSLPQFEFFVFVGMMILAIA